MSEQRPPQPGRLRRVTVSVPEDHAEDLRRFARELRARQASGPEHPSSEWRRVSPSAELLVDPECQARGIIRDTAHVELTAFTGASWPRTSRTPSRAGSREESRGDVCWPRLLSALSSRIGASNPAVRAVTIDRPLLRLFRRVFDVLDYLLSMATD
jgi:hypothetical protein